MIRLITILFYIGYFQITSQSLEFYREKIELIICDKSFEVIGTYYFRNPTSTDFSRSLYYPFVIESSTSYPFEISVIKKPHYQPRGFSEAEKGIFFPVNVSAEDTSIYTIQYKQNITKNKAEYILTTTSKWGNPFSLAEYVIILPIKFTMKELSYEYDTVEESNSNRIYKIKRKNFMPTKNLVVKWEE